MTTPQDMSEPPPGTDASTPAAMVAMALQDTLAGLAPQYGVKSPDWDELGGTLAGQWTRHLLISAVTEAMSQGYIVVAGRDAFAHLSSDWDAQAAQIERGEGVTEHLLAGARTLRANARQLRYLIGIPPA